MKPTWKSLSEPQQELLEAGVGSREWWPRGVSLRALSADWLRVANELIGLHLFENPPGEAHAVMATDLGREVLAQREEAPHV